MTEVLEALNAWGDHDQQVGHRFLSRPGRRVRQVPGRHDGEIAFPGHIDAIRRAA